MFVVAVCRPQLKECGPTWAIFHYMPAALGRLHRISPKVRIVSVFGKLAKKKMSAVVIFAADLVPLHLLHLLRGTIRYNQTFTLNPPNLYTYQP